MRTYELCDNCLTMLDDDQRGCFEILRPCQEGVEKAGILCHACGAECMAWLLKEGMVEE